MGFGSADWQGFRIILFFSFSKVFPLGNCGGPEKDREFCVGAGLHYCLEVDGAG